MTYNEEELRREIDYHLKLIKDIKQIEKQIKISKNRQKVLKDIVKAEKKAHKKLK